MRAGRGRAGLRRSRIELWTSTIRARPIVIVTARALCALDFGDCEERMKELLSRRFEDLVLRHETNPLGVSEKVRAYLAGDLHSLDGIAVDPGGTEFQQTVWSRAQEDSGRDHAHLRPARRLRSDGPSASRAVGLANSLNPVAIVIPCHRLIGSNASLTGYAGGLQRKRWLLRHEGALL